MLKRKLRSYINESVSVRINNRNVKDLYRQYVEVESSNLHAV
jgi:hypothetical protein